MADQPHVNWLRMSGAAQVVWGKQDNVLDPKYAEMFRQALPSARVEYIDECGHVAHLEQPAKLLELVKDFVEAPAGAEVLA